MSKGRTRTPHRPGATSRRRSVWVVAGVVAFGAIGGGIYALREVRRAGLADQRLIAAREHAAQASWTDAAEAYQDWARTIQPINDQALLREYVDVVLKLTNESSTPDHDRWITTAVDLLRRLIQLDPNDRQALGDLVSMLALQGRHEEALRIVEAEWLPLAPSSVDALTARIDSLTALEKYDDALERLDEAIQTRPSEEKLHTRLITLRTGVRKKLPGTEALIERAAQACPKSWSIQLAASRFAFGGADMKRGHYHLDQALELAPTEARVLVAAAQVAIQSANLDQAKAYLDQADEAGVGEHADVLLTASQWARTQPDAGEKIRVADRLMKASHDTEARLINEAAVLYLETDQLDTLAVCIAKLETLPGTEAVVPELKGKLALAKRDFAGAVAHLKEAVAKQPGRAAPAFLLGTAWRQAGNPFDARKAFRKAVQRRPNAIEPRLQLADLTLLAGDLDAAAFHITALKKGYHDNPIIERLDMRLGLQRILADTPRDADALAQLQARIVKAVEAAPEDLAMIRLLTAAYVAGDQHDQAVALLRKKMTIPSLHEPVAIALADLFAQNDQLDQAEKLLRDTLTQPIGSTGASTALMALLVRQERYEDARTLVDQATDAREKARRWLLLGEAAARTGKHDEARQALERSADLDPTEIAPRRQLLRLDAVAKDQARADELVKEIRALEGGDDGLVWRFERARLLLQQQADKPGAVDLAIEFLEHCRKVRPSWVEPRLMLAGVYEVHRNDSAAALAEYEASISRSPELIQTEAGPRYAVLLKQAGRYEQADAVVARIRRQQPNTPFVLAQLTEQRSREGDFAAAADFASRLAEQQSDNIGLKIAAAELLMRAGRTEQAEQVARDAMKLAPNDVRPLDALASVLSATDRSDQAEREYRAFVKTHDTDPEAHVALGRFLSGAKRFDEAAAAHEQAAKLGADRPEILKRISSYFGSRGQHAKQLKYLKQSVIASGQRPDQSMAVAKILLVASTQPADRQAGRRMVQRVLATQPSDPDALILSTLSLDTNTPEGQTQAIERLNRVLDVDPAKPETYRILSRLHIARRAFREASEVISRGLSRFPGNIELRIQSAGIALKDRRWDDAVIDLGMVLKVNPNHPTAQGLWARALEGSADELGPNDPARKRNLQQAGEALNRWCRSNPDSLPVALERLRFHARHGHADRIKDLAEAADRESNYSRGLRIEAASMVLALSRDAELQKWATTTLEKLIQASFQVARAKRYLGIDLQRRGEIDAAESILRQALDADPNDSGAVNALAWLYCEERNRPDDAEKLIDPYIKAHPNDLNALDTYGVILFRQGKLEASLKVLERCRQRAASGSQIKVAVLFHLGRILHAFGQVEPARQCLRDAKESALYDKVLSEKERTEAEKLLQ